MTMLKTHKLRIIYTLNKTLGIFGVSVRRITPIDLRSTTNDPIAAGYLANTRPFLIEAPLERCRGTVFLRLERQHHHFVRTAHEIAQGRCSCFADSPLAQYYRHFCPQSVADIYGIEGKSELGRLPALAAQLLPWHSIEHLQIMEWIASKRASIEFENRIHGARLGADHGTAVFGPVSPQKGALEFSRLAKIYNNISRNGYKRHAGPDGDIMARILTDGSDWRFWILSGQHRASVLAALDYKTIPIRIINDTPIIRRQEVDCWPQVRSGLYTREQALAVFDRIFDGRLPETAMPPEWKTAENAASRPLSQS